MIAEKVLERVGEHARVEQKDDLLLERVARGEATDAELSALERASQQDAELALRLEASWPLGPAAVDRIAERILRSKSVVPIQPRRWAWRRASALVGPLALAAALALVVGARLSPGGPALPAYSVVATGEQAMRGPTAPSAGLRVSVRPAPDARFEVLLRPATAPAVRVVAYAFVVEDAASAPAPLDAKVEVSAEGAVRLTGRVRNLEGAREMRIVVGPPSAIGKFDDAVDRAKSMTGGPEVRVLVVPIERT